MKVKYKSYKNLKKYLGLLDGLIELNELAISKFKIDAEKSGNIESFIKTECKKRGFLVNYKKWPDFYHKIYQVLIVSVHSSFERFVKESKGDLKSLFNNIDFEKIDNKNKKENNLKKLVGYFSNSDKIKVKIDKRKEDLFLYYLKVRNYIVHDVGKKNTRDIMEDFFAKSILPSKEYFTETYNSETAPNKLEKINIDDYLLFSKLIKDLAFIISSFKKFTYNDITNSYDTKKVRKFINNKKRFVGAIMNEFIREWGLEVEDAKQIAEILSIKNNVTKK